MPATQASKSFLIDNWLRQAYEHPKYSKLRFPGSIVCPSCHSELAHVIQETGDRRLLWCGYCGTTYKEKDMVA